MNDELYVVVRNHEHQYSIWAAEREVPTGWNVQAHAATKDQCLEYIRKHWTDMTPLSLRSVDAAPR